MTVQSEAERRKTISGELRSFWNDTAPSAPYPDISLGLTMDVVIIGGGIAGLTSAYMLKQEGLKVAVIEAERIASHVTGHTTGKLTSGHGLFYRYMIDHYSEEQARLYAEANEAAVNRVESTSHELGILCDYERMSNYVYTADGKKLDDIKDEFEAASQLGLPVSYTTETTLPFPIQGAVCYHNQARFHPKKFLIGLARYIDGDGSYIFETTRATEIKENSVCTIVTDKGDIRAEKVIVATNFPFFDPLAIFARQAPYRTYVMGVRLNTPVPSGMWINVETPLHSFRPHPYKNGEEILIVGGEKHKAGQGGDNIKRYLDLEKYIRNTFDVKSIDYHWSTQDNFPNDGVPYIGRLSLKTENVYVATGFKGWGLSHGIVAGELLTDEIMEKDNPWKEIYNPRRIKPLASAKKFFLENVNVAGEMTGGYVSGSTVDNIEKLGKDEGGITEIEGNKVAAYRDEQDNLFCMSPSCAHMGCRVKWNNAERTWDCPCHGSRFNYNGRAHHAPTTMDLDKRECKTPASK
jgi:glycine/D-amino acid oxidase-like deaminating enzyme/nitrite reductase/ring-hydroxylating ferredoxin subunit